MFYKFIVFSIVYCSDTMLIIGENNKITIFIGLEVELEDRSSACVYIKKLEESEVGEFKTKSLYKRFDKNAQIDSFFSGIGCYENYYIGPKLKNLVKSGNEEQLALLQKFLKNKMLFKATILFEKDKTYFIDFMSSDKFKNVKQLKTSICLTFNNDIYFKQIFWSVASSRAISKLNKLDGFKTFFINNCADWKNFTYVLNEKDVTFREYKDNGICTIS